MKIGIKVHSNTGNTYYVAQKLKENLLIAGHLVNIQRLEIGGVEQIYEHDVSKINLDIEPDVNLYEGILFGAPVIGGDLSPLMEAYLNKIDTLKDKSVICVVTQFFPYKWMGGDRAIAKMKSICEEKGANVVGTEVINWMGTHKEKKIEDAAVRLGRLF